MGREFFFAGGASGDDSGASQLCQGIVQKSGGLLVEFISPCPVADGAAAAQNQSNAALQPAAKIQICCPHRGRGDGGCLTAGEKDIAALLVPWLRAAEKCLLVGKKHVHQGKLVGCQRHLACGYHILPGDMTNLAHVVAIGAQHAALSAQRAGVDGLVHHVIAHDDGHIVVNFPGQQSGKRLIVPQICTPPDAYIALDAAEGFGFGRIGIGNGNPLGRKDSLQVSVEPGFHTAFFSAAISRVQVLGQAVGRQSCLFCSEGSTKDSLGRAGNQMMFPTNHQGFIGGNVRM